MDEIENETKQSKQENDLPVIIETHLSEKIEKFISRPVCACTISFERFKDYSKDFRYQMKVFTKKN